MFEERSHYPQQLLVSILPTDSFVYGHIILTHMCIGFTAIFFSCEPGEGVNEPSCTNHLMISPYPGAEYFLVNSAGIESH